MEQETKVTKSKITTPYIIIIIILSLLVIGLLAWALIAQSSLNSRKAAIVENPYCLRTACYSGEQPQAFTIPLKNDPQRYGYETLNYCINNAPPLAFTLSLKECNFKTNDTAQSRLVDFFAWYPSNYLPYCGNNWKNFDVPLASKEEAIPGYEAIDPVVKDDNNLENPNNPLTLNGLNDPAAIFAYCCANNLGPSFLDKLTANPQALKGYETIKTLLNGTSPCK